ncbi:MAG: FHA domain-containing protein [Gammaproteobacteria bacterium]
MPKIIHRFEGKVIKEYATNIARTLSVGRKEENGICLDDSTVSGSHAVFSIVPSPLVRKHTNDVYIEDLESTNGTLMDGKKIRKEQLKHGDTVKIGRHEFVYVDEEQLRMDQTVIMDPAELKKQIGS